MLDFISKVEEIRDLFNQILDEQVKKEIKTGKKTNEDLREISHEMIIFVINETIFVINGIITNNLSYASVKTFKTSKFLF